MELKDIIIEYKRRSGLNNKQIASKLGLSHTTVGRWVKGEVLNVQEETAARLSELVGFDVRTMLDGKVISLRKPILGIVKGGYDLFLEENYIGDELVSEEEYDKGDFFLKVTGNSMAPSGIIDGGLVYVQKCSIVNSGTISVIQVGDEVTVKKVVIEDDGIRLIATNPEVEDRLYSYKQAEELPVRVIGKVLFSKNYM